MDPNLERREKCAVCSRPLKPNKTKFCSRVCSEVRKRQKKRARARQHGEPDYGAFWRKVRQPVGVGIAEGLGLTVDELREFAQEEIDRGELVGFYRDGELRAFGVPLAEGELPMELDRRKAMTGAERHAERKRREAGLRESHRERRRRQRKNQRARASERRRAESSGSEEMQPQAAD
jgi:predicted nucleic acid-binding Zn ribbon protein